VPFSRKLSGFVDICIKRMLKALIYSGDEGRGLLMQYIVMLEDWTTEATTTEEDLSEDQAQPLCELSSVCSGLKSLMEPYMLFDLELGDGNLQNVLKFHKIDPRCTMLEACGLAASDTDVYAQALQIILNNQSKITELRETTASCMELLSECGSVDVAAGRAMAELMKKMPRVVFGLPDFLTKFFRDQVAEKLYIFAKKSIADLDVGKLSQEMLTTSLSMLTEALLVFPMDCEIPAWKAKLAKGSLQIERCGNLKILTDCMSSITDTATVGMHLGALEELVGKMSCMDSPADALDLRVRRPKCNSEFA
jgi:hypothetical protein